MSLSLPHRTLALLAAGSFSLLPGCGSRNGQGSSRSAEPAYKAGLPGAFTYAGSIRRLWTDGQSEVSSYEITLKSGGKPSRMSAVTVVEGPVAATAIGANASPRDPGPPVLTLRLLEGGASSPARQQLLRVQVALSGADGHGEGTLVKAAWSGHDLAGPVYTQLVSEGPVIRAGIYGAGEDSYLDVAIEPGGFSEDSILLWARGLAAPKIAPGEIKQVPFLRSIRPVSGSPQPLVWTRASLWRSSQPEKLTVAAGTFSVIRSTVTVDNGPGWTLWSEASGAARIIAWEMGGARAELSGSTRKPTAALSGQGTDDVLDQLDPKNRPRRAR